MDEIDIAALAALHRQALPGSALSWLGEGYLRAFYRYVQGSEREAVLVQRDQAGQIVAAAVIAWQPAGFLHRLFRRTPMLAYLLRRAPWVAAGFLRRMRALGKSAATMPTLTSPEILAVPEIVDFYTAADRRGRGLGTSLLAQCEEFLLSRGEGRCWVKTEDVPGSRALDFYRRNGLTPLGTTIDSAARFVVLVKSLDDTEPQALEESNQKKAPQNWVDPFEIVRFVIAGGSNTTLTLAIFQLLLIVVPYPIAYAISVAAGVLFAAIVYPNQVFRAPGATLFSRVFATALVSLVVFFAGTAMLHLLQQIGIDPHFGIFVVLPITAFLGYCSFRVMSLIQRQRGHL